jgi:hypothetical protein
MLSSVLNSEMAIKVNIQIMSVYIRLRQMIATHHDLILKIERFETKLEEHDNKILLILEYIRQFEELKKIENDQKNRSRIGFKTSE